MKTCIEYTLNVYKAEYNEFQLRYIRENYTVITETENVLTIAGEQTELENIMENCFASDEKFKESFPEYITKKERELQTLVKLNALKSQIQTVLLEAIKDDCADSEIFHKFQEFYIHEFVNKD